MNNIFSLSLTYIFRFSIEHLNEPTLKILPVTIFEQIKPKLVIFTSKYKFHSLLKRSLNKVWSVSAPNREFNVFFENFEGPFRHFDHKFEWTRLEFEDWVYDNIIDKYPEYKVEHFGGVGKGPDPEQFGSCSQYVLIVRKDFFETAQNGGFEFTLDEDDQNALNRDFCGPDAEDAVYNTIARWSYPVHRDMRSRAEKIFDDLHYYANLLAEVSEEWEKEEDAVFKTVRSSK